MVKAQKSSRQRRRVSDREKHTIWTESNGKGGFVIFCGIRGTDVKTVAGAAGSKETLEYNIRKAKVRFGIKL